MQGCGKTLSGGPALGSWSPESRPAAVCCTSALSWPGLQEETKSRGFLFVALHRTDRALGKQNLC